MNTKPAVTLMAGLPGSGKSTVAKQLDALRVNLDDLRKMMGWVDNSSWAFDQENVAIDTMLGLIEAAVEEGQDVVVDNTHLSSRIPGLIRRRVGGRATFKVISLLDVTVEECIERDALRDSPVGEAVIRKMAKRTDKWRLTEDYMNAWPEVEPVEHVKGLPDCIIVDLDGTIAIHDGRDPYDAEKCYTDLVDDAVSMIVWSLALAFQESDPCHPLKVFFLSGREGTESVKAKTQNWLDRKVVYQDMDTDLLMRAEGDKRPDFSIKYDRFNEHIRGKYNVLCAFDDRDQVVRLWRSMGIRTLQVGYGNF
jgi:predicted kinase